MGMQTDVKATKPLSSTGSFRDQNNSDLGRSRIKAIFATCAGTAGEVIITNGSGGETLFTMATPASASCGYVYLILPGEGILAETTLYGSVTTTTSIVLFYG